MSVDGKGSTKTYIGIIVGGIHAEPPQPDRDNGVELKMRRMETMSVVILRGWNTGPTVKPICTSDALSIPRTADNFTGFSIYAATSTIVYPTRLRIFLFPVNALRLSIFHSFLRTCIVRGPRKLSREINFH